jgi:hypothetical protein
MAMASGAVVDSTTLCATAARNDRDSRLSVTENHDLGEACYAVQR